MKKRNSRIKTIKIGRITYYLPQVEFKIIGWRTISADKIMGTAGMCLNFFGKHDSKYIVSIHHHQQQTNF